MSDAEMLLWRHLRDGDLPGLKFRRQHPIGPYVLDFYCRAAGVAIEVDGDQHDEPSQRAHDQKRTAYLQSRGIGSFVSAHAS